MNFNMVGGMSMILQAVLSGNEIIASKLDEVITLSQSIDSKMTTYGDKGVELGEQMIAAITTLTDSNNANFADVKALMNSLITGQNLTNDQLANLTEMFKVLNSNVEILNTNVVANAEQQHDDAMAILKAIKGLDF